MQTYPVRPRTILALSLGIAACRDGVGVDGGRDPDALRIESSATEVTAGASLTLRALANGARVDGHAVTWETRNTTALSVTDGVVRGLAPGMGWVVARYGAAADSVYLAVRFDRGPDRGAVFSVAGATDDAIRLAGLALQLESLRSDYRSTAIIAHSAAIGSPVSALDAAFAGDSVLSIRLPRQLTVGRHELGAFTVDATNGIRIAGDEGIFLRLREADNRWRMYFSVGTATLEVTSLELPTAQGNTPGRLTARVQFDAAGFTHTIDETGRPHLTPIGDRVVPIYAEVSVDLYRRPTSGLVGEVAGRYAGTARMGGAGHMDGAALVLYWNGLLQFGTPDETYVESTLRVATPATGAFAFSAAVDAPTTLRTLFARFIRVPPGDDPSGQIEDPVTGTATAGTFTISDYRAPTANDFGVVRGQLAATLEFPGGGNTATVAITDFVVPIEPVNGDVLDTPPAPTGAGRMPTTRTLLVSPRHGSRTAERIP